MFKFKKNIKTKIDEDGVQVDMEFHILDIVFFIIMLAAIITYFI